MTVDPCAGGFMTSLLGAFFTYFILVIQESSPASEMTESFGSRSNSRTGIVVPRMRLCMASSSNCRNKIEMWKLATVPQEFWLIRARV